MKHVALSLVPLSLGLFFLGCRQEPSNEAPKQGTAEARAVTAAPTRKVAETTVATPKAEERSTAERPAAERAAAEKAAAEKHAAAERARRWQKDLDSWDDPSPDAILTADYLPYVEGQNRIWTSKSFDDNGQQHSLFEWSLRFEGNGRIKHDNLRTIIPGFSAMGNVGAGYYSYHKVDGGFVRFGGEKKEEGKQPVIVWNQELKIGAKPGDKWLCNPESKKNLRTLEGFGKYKGRACAVVSSESGFIIYGRGMGEMLSKDFSPDGKLSNESHWE